MKLNPNIFITFSRKVVCIIFIMLISANFSFSNALSNDCKGGPGCANCVAREHFNMPGTVAGMENNSCSPGDKNTTCRFETGRIPDDANRIALTVRSDSHEFSGIFVAKSDEYNQPNLSKEFSLPFDTPDIDGGIPIYLLNNSLLC